MTLENNTNTIEREQEIQKNAYVSWKGIEVKIPTELYNAGGEWTEYTPETLTRTLDYYYQHVVTTDNLVEAFQEEIEEDHPHELLDLVVNNAFFKDGSISKKEYDWHVTQRRNRYSEIERARLFKYPRTSKPQKIKAAVA